MDEQRRWVCVQLPTARACHTWLSADRAQRDQSPDVSVHALVAALSQATSLLLRRR